MITKHTELFKQILEKGTSEKKLNKILTDYSSKDEEKIYKSLLINLLNKETDISQEEIEIIISRLRVKHIRTLSGVTPITVLTAPYPCPGNCIFCPSDLKMPKSYISNEPGAQRALMFKFDPYDQVINRITSLYINGHPVQKLELIVLGGTWSVYPEDYQIWFIKRCFDAMNDFNPESVLFKKKKNSNEKEVILPLYVSKYNPEVSKKPNLTRRMSWEELFLSHKINETSYARCIGLSLETRPDELSEHEIIKLRKFGATKIQVGVQSLDDDVLKMNERGHTTLQTIEAFKRLRMAGFKIQAHWMPNLYGSNLEKDYSGYMQLVTDQRFVPDEIKIYPCSMLPNTRLEQYFNDGLWKPYEFNDLKELLIKYVLITPRWIRLSRIVRDIPSTEIKEGNKFTNLRQIIENDIRQRNLKVNEIRSREIRNDSDIADDSDLKISTYETTFSIEMFLEVVTSLDKVKAFLRLTIPKAKSFVTDLADSSIIRELHVYGQTLTIGAKSKSATQHKGLGKMLINKALELSQIKGFKYTSVISSVGTREYYKKFGFDAFGMYQRIPSKYN